MISFFSLLPDLFIFLILEKNFSSVLLCRMVRVFFEPPFFLTTVLWMLLTLSVFVQL